jgi:hypothetical protein
LASFLTEKVNALDKWQRKALEFLRSSEMETTEEMKKKKKELAASYAINPYYNIL